MLSTLSSYIPLLNQKVDHRTEKYFMMGSPLKLITLLAIYMVFVKKIGPRLMQNQKPFQLRNFILLYNALQVFGNLYMSVMIPVKLFTNGYNYNCALTDFNGTGRGLDEANMNYFYYLLKLLDLADTIFFVLRKKDNQITFLHTYHHVIMSFGTFLFIRSTPGGPYLLAGLLNSIVHVFMYSYYLLTIYNPKWITAITQWKKHMTHLQLFQFGYLFVHFIRAVLDDDCQFSKSWCIFGASQNLIFFLLFSNFYIRTYIFKKKSIK